MAPPKTLSTSIAALPSSAAGNDLPLQSTAVRASELFSQQILRHSPVQHRIHRNGRKPMRVMKFGGTSVGTSCCIQQVVEIIGSAARDSYIVVVVSAMSGVTNKLIEAASAAELGDGDAVARILEGLRLQHETALNESISSGTDKDLTRTKMDRIFQQGYHLCQDVMLLRNLTPRARDSISSLGERLSAPLLAAALQERGVASQPIEANEIVVTDCNYGAADPRVDRTRELCQARLRPMLRQGIIPVVTGFIGATDDGVITTLGRGGSDYSATILGLALDADEVIIWTDVDGLMSTDPHSVPNAATIAEISYREAAELAYFGAKVLHPKSLRGVAQCGIPVCIRNTFAPERPGTKITTSGSPNTAGVKAIAVINDIALINVAGSGTVGAPDVLLRTLATLTAIRADLLVVLQSSSHSGVCVVVSSAMAKSIVEALRFEFAAQAPPVIHMAIDSTVSLVTVVGQNMRAISGVVGRALRALDKQNINIVAIAQGSSECSISLVVSQKDVKVALLALHEEFQLGHTEFATPAPNLAAAAAPATTA